MDQITQYKLYHDGHREDISAHLYSHTSVLSEPRMQTDELCRESRDASFSADKDRTEAYIHGAVLNFTVDNRVGF